ncbi:MAG: hypothetical protein AB1742_02065, partial [bacterium]
MKNVQVTPRGKLTAFTGRSQEPHNERNKRFTHGAIFEFPKKPSYSSKLIALTSRELGGGSSVPRTDRIVSLTTDYTYNPRFSIYSEIATDKHGEFGAGSFSGRDSATKFHGKYSKPPFELTAGRRNVGPNFNPTTLGTFIEKDREGSYMTFKYVPSKRWNFATFYDDYHNNLHHNLTGDLTLKTTNSISSVAFSTSRYPNISYRYGKLYSLTDGPRNINGTSLSESTTENLVFSVLLPETTAFVGSRFTSVISRYDIDRRTISSGVGSVLELRSDTRNHTLSTRYKAFATLALNTSIYKSFSDNVSTAHKMDATRINTDTLNLQLNIVPFKFVTGFNFRRSAKNTITTDFQAAGPVTNLTAST